MPSFRLLYQLLVWDKAFHTSDSLSHGRAATAPSSEGAFGIMPPVLPVVISMKLFRKKSLPQRSGLYPEKRTMKKDTSYCRIETTVGGI